MNTKQNKTTSLFPVMEAAPDLNPYDGIHTEAMGEEAKAYAKLVFDSFAAEVPEMWRYLTGEYPNDAACLKYGRELLEKTYTDKAELQQYLFMWLAFYCGFGNGANLTAKLLQMPDEPQQP